MVRIVASILLIMAMPASLAAQDAYQEQSNTTAQIADAYFDAYIARDWALLEGMLAEDASFADDTARLVFGPVQSDGREAMMARFRQGYSAITHMQFIPLRRMISGNSAIYMGDLDWGLDLGEGRVVATQTPMVVIVTIDGGQVIAHRDYVDYSPFLNDMAQVAGGD